MIHIYLIIFGFIYGFVCGFLQVKNRNAYYFVIGIGIGTLMGILLSNPTTYTNNNEPFTFLYYMVVSVSTIIGVILGNKVAEDI